MNKSVEMSCGLEKSKIGWKLGELYMITGSHVLNRQKKSFWEIAKKDPWKFFKFFFSTQIIILWPLEGILKVGTKSEGVVSSWYISGILTLMDQVGEILSSQPPHGSQCHGYFSLKILSFKCTPFKKNVNCWSKKQFH